MQAWEKRLAHARCVRDALVACGNPAPKQEDPPGGLIEIRCRVFVGAIFTEWLYDHGHSTAAFELCACAQDPS